MSECIVEQPVEAEARPKKQLGRPRMDDGIENIDQVKYGMRLYMRQYMRDHKDTTYKYVRKTKNQCAYIGPKIGRCPHTTYREYCGIHKGGVLCTKPKKPLIIDTQLDPQ